DRETCDCWEWFEARVGAERDFQKRRSFMRPMAWCGATKLPMPFKKPVRTRSRPVDAGGVATRELAWVGGPEPRAPPGPLAWAFRFRTLRVQYRRPRERSQASGGLP